MSGASPGRIAGQLSFQLSPIILTGGLAQNIPGQMLPIIALTEGFNFAGGLLSGGDIDLNNCFANFVLMAGGTLIANRLGEYSFANQGIAANAIIADPLELSLKMICPARGPAGFAIKTATMTSMVLALKSHIQSGGTFTVATPAYFYTNCLLLNIQDTTTNPKQPQSEFVWRFRKPLLTLEDTQNAYNTVMNGIANGFTTDGATSGAAATSSPLSLSAPGTYPSAGASSGAGVAGVGSAGLS